MQRLITNTVARIFILISIVGYSNSSAWIYPEHRDIALLAIQNLSQQNRSTLDKLWVEARMGYEGRLTESIIDPAQSIDLTQIDFAAQPGIAGDHSTSSSDMLNNILRTEWILEVADIAAQLKIDLANSENRHEHVNSLRDSDIKLQRADPQYATRAGSNNVHLLRPVWYFGIRTAFDWRYYW